MVALLHSFLTDPACNAKFLVTATNQTNGVEVHVFPDIKSDKASYSQIELKDFFLSPECGERFGRCNQPLLVTVNDSTSLVEQSFVVILPLEKALGLLKLSVVKIDFRDETHIINLSEQKYNCSPASVYNIRDSYYIVCANADTHNVKFLKLSLNVTHIKKSYLSDQQNPTQLTSVRNLTNSLYVDLPAQSGPVIYFADGYSAFNYKPLPDLMETFDIQLQDNDCFATSLEYIGEWDMLIYCDNSRAVYVDINDEHIYEFVEYVRDGRPYVCPNPDVYLAVYPKQEYILYGFRSTMQAKNFEMSGNSAFDNGVCLGSQNVTLFAFTDRKRGTQVLNASAGSIRSLSGAMCTNHPCQPLIVLQDRYLVIREKRGASWSTSVLDSHNNFSLVLEAQHSNADLMSLIDVCVGSQDPLGPHNSQESNSDTSGGLVGGLVGGLITVVVAIAAIVLIVAVIYIIKKSNRHRTEQTLSSPVVGHEQRRHSEFCSEMVPGADERNAIIIHIVCMHVF